jgi:protein LTV1
MDLDETRSVGMSSTTSSVARSLLPEEVLPSEFVQKRTYQDQQDVPDEIAGFQPDMDPRLREVLEALEDEEYVDDEEDIFAELTKDGYEVDKDEWDMYGEQQLFEEDDAGWESDDTIKAPGSPPPSNVSLADLNLPEGEDAKPPEDVQAQPPADPTEGAWLEEFEKFKAADKAGQAGNKPAKLNPLAPSTLESSVLSSLASGRRKKRKGAKTSTTNYSMTSSALARTGPLTLLDDRFDKIENAYAMAEFPEEEEDDYLAENASAMSGMTGLSKASKASRYSTASGMSGVSGVSSYSRATDSEAPQLTRSDFDGIMDDFLGTHSKTGKLGRRVKRGGPQTGMEQLDEIRSQLGPARMKNGARSTAK